MAPTFRTAVIADLPVIVAMLADDDLGRGREDLEDLSSYRSAFGEIDGDPNQLLCVADSDGEIVGTLQLTFIPGLSRRGGRRGLIEAVRIASRRRGEGIGREMILWAVEQCRDRGCAMVQLTTDKSRTDAHRFYDDLGFDASHVGYKLEIGRP